MKNILRFHIYALAVSGFIIASAIAHPGPMFDSLPDNPEPPPKANGHGHEHNTAIPGTVPEVWQEIGKQQGRLVALVEEKKLDELHPHAFAIRDLVQALVAKVPETKKADTELAAKHTSAIATDIEQSAAAGAQKTTTANVKAMGDALAALKAKIGA